MELRGVSTSYDIFIKKNRNNRENDLLSKVKDIEQNLTDNNLEDLENVSSTRPSPHRPAEVRPSG